MYLERIVTTQTELDQALAEQVDQIDIKSPEGVWLAIASSGSATVRAYDSATVRAYGSATVQAYDSATVQAYGSATVQAYDSATVRASGSATVQAYGSATVRASGSATVRAYGSGTVQAGKYTAVHLHSDRVQLTGGVVSDHTKIDLTDPAAWCEYHGVDVADGIATVYKAVNDQWTTERGTDYTPGTLPSCQDWADTDDCGNGLHFGPSPVHALYYKPDATHYLAVGVKLSELRPISGSTAKCKAPRAVVPCIEVDEAGRFVAPVAVSG